MNIARSTEIPPSPAAESGLPDFIARLGIGGRLPSSLRESTRQARLASEVLVDAASVAASLVDGVLHVAPARGVTVLDLHIEECSDGSILISDDLGHAGYGPVPEFSAPLAAIHISVGVEGDDHLVFDFPPASRRRGQIRIFTAFGDDITASSASLFISTRRHAAMGTRGGRAEIR